MLLCYLNMHIDSGYHFILSTPALDSTLKFNQFKILGF